MDVQNDFISGSLNIKHCAAQHDGLEVVEPINRLLDTVTFDAVFYSLDWHPVDHVSFIDNLPFRYHHFLIVSLYFILLQVFLYTYYIHIIGKSMKAMVYLKK